MKKEIVTEKFYCDVCGKEVEKETDFSIAGEGWNTKPIVVSRLDLDAYYGSTKVARDFCIDCQTAILTTLKELALDSNLRKIGQDK